MGKKYENPPIIEAVCEFRITSDTKWDLTIPGLIYERVSKEYPIKEQRLIQEVEMNQSQQELQQQIRTTERIFFLSDERKTFIQVGPHLLAVNSLKPYPAWGVFKPKIERAFRSLVETVDVQGLQRIGLRYINRIEIPGLSRNLGDYFEFRPFLGQGLPNDVTNFIVGCIFSFLNGRDACKVELTKARPEKPDNAAFLLDLDYYLARPQGVSVNEALEWVNVAHSQIEGVFEGCIKDSLREIFREVK